jgi:hypothetical protein
LRAGAFLVLLALLAAGAASAKAPRSLDQKRALAIGLRRADAGRGWQETGRRSPYLIDVGSSFGTFASGGMTACVGSTSPGEMKTGLARTVSATALTTLRYPSTNGTLLSVAMVMKPGSAITPGAWRSELAGSFVPRCLAAALKSALPGAVVVSSGRRPFETGAPLSAAYRVVFRLGSPPVATHVYVDVFLQANGRAMAETLLIGTPAGPSKALERRVTAVLDRRLARFPEPIGALPTS